MSVEQGHGGGNSKAKRPRQDRRLTNRLTRKVKRGGTVNSDTLDRLFSVISKSDAQGTLNNRDRQRLGNLLEIVGKDSPGGGLGVSGMIRQNPTYRDLTKFTSQNGGGNGLFGDIFKEIIDSAGKGNKPKAGNEAPRTGANGNSATGRSGQGRNGGPGRNGGRNRGGRGPNTSVPGAVYNGLGEFPGIDRDEARLEVTNENNRLIQALLDEAGARRQDLKFDINTANGLFDRTKGDLNYVFNEADDFIGAKNQQIDQRFTDTGSQLGQLFQQLQGTLGQTSAANRNAAVGEQSRLGIQQSGMGNFDSDANFQQMLAQQSGAGAQATNQMMQGSANEIGSLLQSMSQASLASAMGRATNDRNDAITGARQGYRSEVSDIRGDIRDVNKNRPAAINELFKAMQNDAYQRWAETQQMDFQNQLATNNFNLDVSKLNSDNLWKKAEQRERQRQAAIERRTQQGLHEAEELSRTLADKTKNLVAGMFGWG